MDNESPYGGATRCTARNLVSSMVYNPVIVKEIEGNPEFYLFGQDDITHNLTIGCLSSILPRDHEAAKFSPEHNVSQGDTVPFIHETNREVSEGTESEHQDHRR